MTFLAHPELRVDADTAVMLDASKASRISMGVEQQGAHGGTRGIFQSIEPPGLQGAVGTMREAEPLFEELYAGSVPGASSDAYKFTNWLHAEEPEVELIAEAPERFRTEARWIGDSRPDLSGRVAVVSGGSGTPEELAKVDARGKLVVVAATSDFSYDFVVSRARNVADAGGKLVYFAITAPGAAFAGSPPASRRTKTASEIVPPVLAASGPTAQRFLALAKADRASATFNSKAVTRYRYEVVATESGAIPQVLHYHPKNAELAAVRTRYFAATAEQRVVDAQLQRGRLTFFPLTPSRVSPPSERTEYFSPGHWTLSNTGRDDAVYDHLVAWPRELRAGQRYDMEWNKPVHTPALQGTYFDGFNERPWAWQRYGTMNANIPLLADAAGNVRSVGQSEADKGRVRLWSDGEQVADQETAGWFDISLPTTDRASYRLLLENTRTAPSWPLAGRVSAEWTFASGPTEYEETVPLPLLTVGLDPKLDLRATAPGGKAFSFPATVARQTGTGTPTVTSFTVDVSYDDGASWQPATADRSRYEVDGRRATPGRRFRLAPRQGCRLRREHRRADRDPGLPALTRP